MKFFYVIFCFSFFLYGAGAKEGLAVLSKISINPFVLQTSLSESLKQKKNKKASQSLKKESKKTRSVQSSPAVSENKVESGKCTTELIVEKNIGPGTLDSLENALRITEKKGCSSLLLLINTPGGSLLSTRKIVEVILNAPVPILCLVHPVGAHAGSAGAIILQACHINGALTATNLGAATPVLGTGKNMAKDLRNKMINDTTSWLDSLTELRKRNKKFGREIVVNAKAVKASEAFKLGAVDFFGSTKEDFLKFAHGRKTQIQDKEGVSVRIGEIYEISRGLRYYFVHFITDPEFVYLLFLGSLMLIYFELTHTGFILPGVLGVMGLVLAFVGMHKLSFAWGGMMLILLGLIFMVLEAFVTSYGVLALSGVVSFVFGSLFLFDPSKTGGLTIPFSTIIIAGAVFSAFSIGLAYLALASLRKSRKKEEEKWIGQEGEVVKIKTDEKGLFEINGEIWKYKSKDSLKKGDRVKVLSYSRLVFEVEKLKT